MVPLGLVAIRFGEVRQRAIQSVVLAAVAGDADRIAGARMGARQQGPAWNAQKSNGSPVINDTGIEAFMFFICRTK